MVGSIPTYSRQKQRAGFGLRFSIETTGGWSRLPWKKTDEHPVVCRPMPAHRCVLILAFCSGQARVCPVDRG